MITHTYALEDDAADRIPQSWGSPHTQQQQHSPGGVQRQRTADPYTAHRDSTTHSDRTAQYGKDRAAQYSRGRAAPYSRQQRRNSTAAETGICINTERLSDFVTTAAAQQHTAIEEL